MARELRDDGYTAGYHRQKPEDDDWTRRYLRGRAIPCEGPMLDHALEELDADQWSKLKNAWRQHEYQRNQSRIYTRGFNTAKKLGWLWQRVIAMGLITEEDALALAGESEKWPFYDDAGCEFVIRHSLGMAAERAKKAAELSVGKDVSPLWEYLTKSKKIPSDEITVELMQETVGRMFDDNPAHVKKFQDADKVAAAIAELRRNRQKEG